MSESRKSMCVQSLCKKFSTRTLLATSTTVESTWKISREYSKAEIGFELLPEHQGKGIMQEALPKIIEYGFKNMKLRTIEGEVDPNNLK